MGSTTTNTSDLQPAVAVLKLGTMGMVSLSRVLLPLMVTGT